MSLVLGFIHKMISCLSLEVKIKIAGLTGPL